MHPDSAAISIAAWKGDVDALRRELARGVAVDLDENHERATALQLVCRRGANIKLEDRVACVELLLEYGATLNAGLPNNPGHSGHGTRVYYMTPLIEAAMNPCAKVVEMLIAAGSDVNAQVCCPIQGSCSPLMGAVLASSIHTCFPPHVHTDGLIVVDALLKAGADANPPEYGSTVMEWAIELSLRRLYPLLLRAGSVLPTRMDAFTSELGQARRADPYLLRVESAGGFKAHEKVHREKILATFTPKFTHLVPPELVPLIVEYAFHFGFY